VKGREALEPPPDLLCANADQVGALVKGRT